MNRVRLSLFVLFLARLSCRGHSLFINGSAYEYQNRTIECTEGTECDIFCTGLSACENSVIYCPSGNNCNIYCNNIRSCYNAHINCPTNDGTASCNLICLSSSDVDQTCQFITFNANTTNNPSIICTGANSCGNSTILYTNPDSSGKLTIYANDSQTPGTKFNLGSAGTHSINIRITVIIIMNANAFFLFYWFLQPSHTFFLNQMQNKI